MRTVFRNFTVLRNLIVLYFALRPKGSNIQAMGRAIAQAVSHRPPTAEARVPSRASPCGICGGQSGWHWDRFFPRVIRFSPVNFITHYSFPLLGKTKKH